MFHPIGLPQDLPLSSVHFTFIKCYSCNFSRLQVRGTCFCAVPSPGCFTVSRTRWRPSRLGSRSCRPSANTRASYPPSFILLNVKVSIHSTVRRCGTGDEPKQQYRLGPVNSKSFVGHFFLRIKRIFELKILF